MVTPEMICNIYDEQELEAIIEAAQSQLESLRDEKDNDYEYIVGVKVGECKHEWKHLMFPSRHVCTRCEAIIKDTTYRNLKAWQRDKLGL